MESILKATGLKKYYGKDEALVKMCIRDRHKKRPIVRPPRPDELRKHSCPILKKLPKSDTKLLYPLISS